MPPIPTLTDTEETKHLRCTVTHPTPLLFQKHSVYKVLGELI